MANVMKSPTSVVYTRDFIPVLVIPRNDKLIKYLREYGVWRFRLAVNRNASLRIERVSPNSPCAIAFHDMAFGLFRNSIFTDEDETEYDNVIAKSTGTSAALLECLTNIDDREYFLKIFSQF